MGKDSPIDRRIVRTKKLICDALVTLIEEKGFDALSVKDITTRANINRGTFYLHYKDKFELLDKTMDDAINGFESVFLQSKSLRFADFVNTDEPISFTQEIFEYIKENEALMRVMFSMGGSGAFQTKFRKMMENNLQSGFFGGLRVENFLVPHEYLVSYTLHANFGVIQSWLNIGCQESPKEMAKILSRIHLDGPFRSSGSDLSNM
ncbi:MAG: TetR/AcrR family transcriptional regulator [Chloroflexi bacterium]|nr:TetR/AcrR family transcriptional regulator [Chloroflexota bacterium]